MSKDEMKPARIDRRLSAAHERIEELERKVASRDAEVAELKKELYSVSVAIDDPRTDLTMTMVEVITDQHKERDQLRAQAKMLRDKLIYADLILDKDYNHVIPSIKRALAATDTKL